MHPKDFISKLDEDKIISAIRRAELQTSGEIRIYISSRKRTDALGSAQRRFAKLRMTKTRHRNGVLIYFAPLTHQFAIVGDVGIHAKCGDSFWQSITAEMTPILKSNHFTDAIIHAINRVGQALAEHFPSGPDDKNELPDSILRD